MLSGINRVLSMETPSGGFGYWPGATEPLEWATAYATHMLIDAKKAGYAVPDDRLEEVLGWIDARVTAYERGEKIAHERWNHYDEQSEAYLHYVLARAGRGKKAPDPGADQQLPEGAERRAGRGSVPAEGRALPRRRSPLRRGPQGRGQLADRDRADQLVELLLRSPAPRLHAVDVLRAVRRRSGGRGARAARRRDARERARLGLLQHAGAGVGHHRPRQVGDRHRGQGRGGGHAHRRRYRDPPARRPSTGRTTGPGRCFAQASTRTSRSRCQRPPPGCGS